MTPSYSRHVPELDGVRAIAIVGVFAVHLNLALGGVSGVQVFFVLSGFLISSLLADERKQQGQIDLRSFYWRRAGRLMPALVISVLATAAVFAAFSHQSRGWLAVGTVASLLYVTNWVSFGINRFLPGVNYSWSLAQEEQFYLLAPLLLRRLPRRRYALAGRWLLLVFGLLAVARLLLLAALPQLSISTYHNPVLNLDGMTLGVALALLVRSGSGLAQRVRPAAGRLRWAAAAVVVVVASYVLGAESGMRLGVGVLLAEAGAAMLILHIAADVDSWVKRVLRSRPVRWVGERSYALYVYQIGVLTAVTAAAARVGLSRPVAEVAAVALTVGVAAFSTRFIEVPIRTWVRARQRTRGHADPIEPATVGRLTA